MKDFAYAAPSTLDDTIALLSDSWGKTEILAGGTDLLTSLKQDLTAPSKVVSLRNVKGLRGISKKGGVLNIGATTTLAELLDNKDVQKNFPALTTAAQNVAAPQILNLGTVGGDLLQRPRCWYYRQGLGLLAQKDGKSLIPDGENRYHAIFGNTGPAYFVNPSSLAPGLIALGATMNVQGSGGERSIAAGKFFSAPSSESEREYVLKSDEVLTGVSVPLNGLKNGTYEIRQRRGLDWPMVAASVAFKLDGGTASDANVVLGHVAPTPWQSASSSSALNGQQVNEASAAKAGVAAQQGASPMSMNGYKVIQVKVAVKRAVMAAIA